MYLDQPFSPFQQTEKSQKSIGREQKKGVAGMGRFDLSLGRISTNEIPLSKSEVNTNGYMNCKNKFVTKIIFKPKPTAAHSSSHMSQTHTAVPIPPPLNPELSLALPPRPRRR
jgi:hypothetical protein